MSDSVVYERPDPTSAMREHVLRLRAWANHEHDPGERLRRGAVYWYDFREPRVEYGEVYKTRPVLVMNENPAWCRFMNRALNVIPLSSRKSRSKDIDKSMPVTIDEVTRYAVLVQATTINSRRLLDQNYVGQLDDEQLEHVTESLRQNMFGNFTQPQTTDILPANVFEVEWHDKEKRRPFCVLTDRHLVDPTYPVGAIPLTEEHLGDNLQGTVKPRPVSLVRFSETEASFVGTLPSDVFERLRMNYARQFGL